MKPAARLQSVIEILDEVMAGKRPADQITTDYFKARRYAGSKDRRAVHETLYRIIRNQAKLTWFCEKLSFEPSPRHFVLVDCILEDQAVEDLFTGDTYCPDALSIQEKEILPILAELDIQDAPEHVLLEYPQWVEADLKTSLGTDFTTVMQALNHEAPLDLRVNALHEYKDQAQEVLKAQNIEVTPTELSPLCLRSAKKIKLGGIKAYKDGLVDIQDEGSQLIALLSDVKGQELVMDFCAGAGGKTLAMAAEMNNQGILYALDIASKRLYKMRPRLERAGVKNVQLNPIRTESDPWLKQFEGRVDRLLIDAPCSGVGAWRRNPESRWKMTPELLDDLIARQSRILNTSAHLVKKGGRLIYATCSMLKRENEDQIDAFLKAHEDFTLKSVSEVWAEVLESDCPFEGDYMKMRPDLHQSDGFFCAILERKA
jgi:16S rRNA (cytosine967-C5)-methyltransferase